MSAAAATTEGQIAGRIRDLRRSADWTQAELAERAGLATETISRIETGRRGLSVASLCWIAQALGVRPQTLLEGQAMISSISQCPRCGTSYLSTYECHGCASAAAALLAEQASGDAQGRGPLTFAFLLGKTAALHLLKAEIARLLGVTDTDPTAAALLPGMTHACKVVEGKR